MPPKLSFKKDDYVLYYHAPNDNSQRVLNHTIVLVLLLEKSKNVKINLKHHDIKDELPIMLYILEEHEILFNDIFKVLKKINTVLTQYIVALSFPTIVFFVRLSQVCTS